MKYWIIFAFLGLAACTSDDQSSDLTEGGDIVAESDTLTFSTDELEYPSETLTYPEPESL
jgi:hypothetical protein